MTKVKELNIALLGLGTVGKGLVNLLNENKDEILNKHNAKINVVKVYERNADKLEKFGMDRALFTNNMQDIYDDASIDIVVELLGRIHPSKEFIEGALKAKKNVVTANKDLICMHGGELLKVAKQNGVTMLYEASCLGAVPAINTLKNNFLGDEIKSIKGIFNGTTNYMLTKMTQEGLSYEACLKQAQELGYAESDPTNDVEGIDAAYKLCILSRFAFGLDAQFDDISKKGITKITSQDIEIAGRLGYTIKLLAIAKCNNQKLEMRVNPVLVSNEHQLSKINGAFNACTVEGNYSDEITLIGRGAGSYPTASAVANDIMNFAHKMGDVGQRTLKKAKIEKDSQMKFYIRLSILDKAGVMAVIAKIFGDNKISIESAIQDKNDNPDVKSLIIVTHSTSSLNMNKALDKIAKADVVQSVDSVLEVLG